MGLGKKVRMPRKLGALLLGVVSSTVAFGAVNVSAQGSGDGAAPVHYNVAAEITVKGTVETLKAGPQQGTHVVLKTASGALELLLGPSWYLAERKYTLAKGEQIEVVGAKTQVASGEVLVVREIKKDSETMLFRDRKGLPLWAGRGRR